MSSDVVRSARVQQLEGLFDVPPSPRSELTWTVALPLDARVWHIGLIVGPSGSGKSSIARHFWPEQLAHAYDWPPDRSVLDAFPESMGIKDIVGLLSSVGFSSPPAWVRPFRVLSNGEQFRVTMARVLAEHQGGIAVVDEFTSVVDRTVAQVGSAAIAKTVRARGQQFVAVTCHEDVEAWLTPDWIFRPDTGEFHWRALQCRPDIGLHVARVHRSAWMRFRRHHYLDGGLNDSAICFVAVWRGRAVAFAALLSFPHARTPGWLWHRIVTLPDYQGVSIGSALADFVSGVMHASGKPVYWTSGHPAVIAHCARSPLWQMNHAPQLGRASSRAEKTFRKVGTMKRATDRLTAGFRYVGPRADPATVRTLLGGE